MSQNLQNFVKFQKFQLENLVDFEKCCKTHIFLQKSVPIQPKTSNILPKFCQPTLSDVSAGRRSEAANQDLAKAKGRRHDGRSAKFRQNVARFRLYRHRFLQVNTRFSGFFKIYQIIQLKILKFGNILQILQHLQNFC